MLTNLESLKPNRPKVTDSIQKRILCIIEGELELKYIVKIFQLNGYSYDCFQLTEDIVKVAWCDKLPKHMNIVTKEKGTCKFDGGGSCKGSPVPTPAIKAFEMYNQDLSIFDSIFVFFDADKDRNKEVEKYFRNKFSSLKTQNCLLVSNPCFESSLIDFCFCGNCRKTIDYIPNISIYPCIKYKGESKKVKRKKLKRERYTGEFRLLPCFAPPISFIENKLKIHNLLEKSNLNCVNDIIKDFMLKQGI